MPNDMSPCPAAAVTPPTDALLDRAARFVARAKTLAQTVALTQDEATTALGHLAGMQDDLARARHDKTRPLRRAAEEAADPFQHAERALHTARTDLTEALLHAVPSETETLGLVPHGPVEGGSVCVHPVSICRDMLDLEGLRGFLSDAALREAVVRKAAATGRADVVGVAYAALPPAATPNCTVM